MRKYVYVFLAVSIFIIQSSAFASVACSLQSALIPKYITDQPIESGMKRAALEQTIETITGIKSTYSAQHPMDKPPYAEYTDGLNTLSVTFKNGMPAPYVQTENDIQHYSAIDQTALSWEIKNNNSCLPVNRVSFLYQLTAKDIHYFSKSASSFWQKGKIDEALKFAESELKKRNNYLPALLVKLDYQVATLDIDTIPLSIKKIRAVTQRVNSPEFNKIKPLILQNITAMEKLIPIITPSIITSERHKAYLPNKHLSSLAIIQILEQKQENTFQAIIDDASQGNALAQFNLALMYAKGYGVPQSYSNAYMWASLSSLQDISEAPQELEVMTEHDSVLHGNNEGLIWDDISRKGISNLKDSLARTIEPDKLSKTEALIKVCRSIHSP